MQAEQAERHLYYRGILDNGKVGQNSKITDGGKQ